MADRASESASSSGTGGPTRAARSDTRARIQEVALDLFAEQGYETTSLREIADRLGVTKAALYYHFKSKEEIVASTVDDFLSEIDELVTWAGDQPRTADTKQEVVRRYSGIVTRRFPSMRFFQQNPAGIHNSGLGERFQQRMRSLHGVLCDEDATPERRIKTLLAIVSMHVGGTTLLNEDESLTPEVAQQSALNVALDLIGLDGS
jgi:AcrR family transcriptional regulator